MNIIVLNNQSLLDLAIQHFGDATAAFDIALANDLSITDEIVAGAKYFLPAQTANAPTVGAKYFSPLQSGTYGTANRQIAAYYQNRGLKPATALAAGDYDERTFDNNFDSTFN
jgi:hypothetical protein